MKKLFSLIFLSIFLLIGCEKTETVPSPDTDLSTKTGTDISKKPSSNDFNRSFGNTINNSINFSHNFHFFVAEYNDDFYYSTNNAPGIFKQSGSSLKSEKLNNDEATFINVYRDKLYYNSKGKLIKVDLDGVSNREVLVSSSNDIVLNSMIISNHTLFFVTSTLSKHDSGFSEFSLNKYDLKENKLISTEIKANRSFTFIDEYRYISGSRELFNYVSIDEKRVFPIENEENSIRFLGQNEDSLICQVGTVAKTDQYQFLHLNNNGNKKILDLPTDSNYLVYKNKVFYVNPNGLSYLDLLTGEAKSIHNEKMNKNNYLFEFDNILYYSDSSKIIKMYDIEKDILHPDFIPPVPSLDQDSSPDEKSEAKPKPQPEVAISNEDLARNLILKADKSNIKQAQSNGGRLYYLSNSSEKWISLAKAWNINLKGTVVSFELVDSVGTGSAMINQYIVEIDTKKVYYIPPQGMMPAYLMENDQKIKKFEYNNR